MLSRGLTLAKASIKAGSLMLQNKGSDSPQWLNQVEGLVNELGRLKGTAMKVGQSLSMYGEHFLPKEVNELLKSLQASSPPLSWSAVEAVVRKELGPEKYDELEIDTNPAAAASIGQVHRAKIKATGEEIVLKVQYPGVDGAVDSDLKLMKFILNVSNVIPRGPGYDQVFSEVREMFLQEIDYRLELKHLNRFHELLNGDDRYVLPKAFDRYCTGKILALEYLSGERGDSPRVQALPLTRRNALGRAFLDLYLRELVEFQLMQTDPHLGNYLIQIDPVGDHDRLVLFDFGAVREVPDNFLRSYRHLMLGGYKRDRSLLLKGGRELGLVQPEDPDELGQRYVDLCMMMTEPFNEENQPYDWGNSDLPKRVATQATQLALRHRLRAPPRELIFLDRKLGGVFIFMSVLKCVTSGRDLIERTLAQVTIDV